MRLRIASPRTPLGKFYRALLMTYSICSWINELTNKSRTLSLQKSDYAPEIN